MMTLVIGRYGQFSLNILSSAAWLAGIRSTTIIQKIIGMIPPNGDAMLALTSNDSSGEYHGQGTKKQ